MFFFSGPNLDAFELKCDELHASLSVLPYNQAQTGFRLYDHFVKSFDICKKEFSEPYLEKLEA